jgi:hypothetical protein
MAFMLYCSEHRAPLAAKGLSTTEIGKTLGAEWRELPEATKDKYKAQAAAKKGTKGTKDPKKAKAGKKGK